MNLQVSDTITWRDSVKVVLGGLNLQVQVSDSLSLSDDYVLFCAEIARLRLGDSLNNLNDSASIKHESPNDTVAADRLLFSDFVTLLLTIALAVSDQMIMQDSARLNNGGSLADSLSMDDNITVQVNSHITINVADSMDFADSISTLQSTQYLRNYLNDVPVN